MHAGFDYSASAELFFNRGVNRALKMSYRRFESAAEAIRFAVEDLGRKAPNLTTLEVNEMRFGRDGIQRLYDAPDYPLDRAAEEV